MDPKKYLESRNISYKELAAMIGVSASTVCNYLCGKRIPRADIMQRITKVTKGNVTLEDILKLRERPL